MSESKPIIAVDFDGVIHGYSEGWKDGSIYDKPKDGAREALEFLSKKCRVIIWSTRNFDREVKGVFQGNQVEEVREYLHRYGIPFDEIYTGNNKPICKLFIDDNAYRFESWDKLLNDFPGLL